MKKYLLSFLSFTIIAIQLNFAQSSSKFGFPKIKPDKASGLINDKLPLQRNCGTMENLEMQMKQDPNLKQRMEAIEVETQKQIQVLNSNSANKVSTVYKIPIVVHVVYNNASENVSDAQIYSQITALNRDYRRQNADINQVPLAFSGVAADVEIEFCMASLDPNGAVTNGITRTSTTHGAFSNTSNDVKSNATGGKSPWNTSNYMNLWVCDLQGQLLGYAQFPGGSPTTDGVVIDYAYFGNKGTATAPFDLGRTATHEVGHYLNLRHIWGDSNCGDDFVNDTPTQQTSNGQCPLFPHQTCGNTSSGDMFMNYMDYVDDACMQMFSEGQKARMIAALTVSRATLLNNNNINCTIPSAALSCDTIANYLGSNSLVVYRTTDVSQPGTGFISGTNSYGDIGYAEKFNSLQPAQKIYGALIGFGKVYGFSSATVNVKVWAADFAGGKPGTVLASIPVTLGQIISDVNSGNYTAISFNNPITLSAAYYIGIEFNPANVDSIALYTTINGQVSTGRAYEGYDTGDWYPFTDATNSWGVNVALAVAPVICIDFTGINDTKDVSNDIQIFPNPSSGTFNIQSNYFENEKIELKIYNSIGALVLNEIKFFASGNQFNFDLSGHPEGLYIVEVKTKEHSILKKINLIH